MFSELKKDDLLQINEIKETNKPHIKDSGERRQFETGAVRDIQEGKGRCDLLPLDVVAGLYSKRTDKVGVFHIIYAVNSFTETGNETHLVDALEYFLLNNMPFGDGNWSTMFLEVSKHFEEGAKKYGEYNWQKGIPTHCYIDSAVRHYLKYLRGDTDEPHDRAFVWNILCCIWTCKHKPELNDYDPDRDKIVNALCEVGNVNVVSPEEVKAAMDKATEDISKTSPADG